MNTGKTHPDRHPNTYRAQMRPFAVQASTKTSCPITASFQAVPTKLTRGPKRRILPRLSYLSVLLVTARSRAC